MQREVTKDTNVKSQGSSEGSTAAIRKRHLEVKFGELSGETAHVKIRGDHRGGSLRWDQCFVEVSCLDVCMPEWANKVQTTKVSHRKTGGRLGCRVLRWISQNLWSIEPQYRPGTNSRNDYGTVTTSPPPNCSDSCVLTVKSFSYWLMLRIGDGFLTPRCVTGRILKSRSWIVSSKSIFVWCMFDLQRQRGKKINRGCGLAGFSRGIDLARKIVHMSFVQIIL